MVNKTQEELIPLPEGNYVLSYEQLNALISFEKLWTELSTWLRSLLISTAEDLKNKEAVMTRLYSVITDFYYIFRVFYGPVIAQYFTDTLARLIIGARTLIESLKSGDNAGADAATAEMHKAADELSVLFAKINIYWDEEQWKYLLYQFIRLFTDETVAMLSGNHELEIAIYDRLDDLTDIIGSYMARGIIARSIGAALKP